MSTNVDARLSALSSAGAFPRPTITTTTGATASSAIDTLREFEAFARGTLSSSLSSSPTVNEATRVRELEDKVRRLKIQLAEEQMSKATVMEELQQVRGQLTKSQEVLVSFANRAREDREEAASTARKRMARSEPSGSGGGDSK